MTDISTTLAEIRERADKATEGPWEAGGIGEFGWSVHGEHFTGLEVEDSEQGKADAVFIAGARTDVPALLAAVEAVLGHSANMHGENYHYAHGYADAVANIRYAIDDALDGDGQ